jgi:hypothetical protein
VPVGVSDLKVVSLTHSVVVGFSEDVGTTVVLETVVTSLVVPRYKTFVTSMFIMDFLDFIQAVPMRLGQQLQV